MPFKHLPKNLSASMLPFSIGGGLLLVLLFVWFEITHFPFGTPRGSRRDCMISVPRVRKGILRDENRGGDFTQGLNVQATKRREENYLNHTQDIEGWMHPLHHRVVKYLSEAQIEAGVIGLIGEIGVHHGKFFYSLATNLDHESEYAVAIDVFEDQLFNVDGSGHGSMDRFIEHGAAMGFPKEIIKIEKADSTQIAASRLKDISSFSYRIFSVDGGHAKETTLNDLHLAEALLHENGFVVLNDFVNPDWMGVADGFFQYVNQCSSGLKPFLWLYNKLYLAPEHSHGFYLRSVEGFAAIKCTSQSGMHQSRFSISGSRVCVAHGV
jgi:hypothetical protein